MLSHELGHYLLGFKEEYNLRYLIGETCGSDYHKPSNPNHLSYEEIRRPGLMTYDYPYITEMSSLSDYDGIVAKNVTSQQMCECFYTCWQSFENYFAALDSISIKLYVVTPEADLQWKPIRNRMTHMKGPIDGDYSTSVPFDVSKMMVVDVSHLSGISNPEYRLLTLQTCTPSGVRSLAAASIYTTNTSGQERIYQGMTNDQGQLMLLGVHSGDIISYSYPGISGYKVAPPGIGPLTIVVPCDHPVWHAYPTISGLLPSNLEIAGTSFVPQRTVTVSSTVQWYEGQKSSPQVLVASMTPDSLQYRCTIPIDSSWFGSMVWPISDTTAVTGSYAVGVYIADSGWTSMGTPDGSVRIQFRNTSQMTDLAVFSFGATLPDTGLAGVTQLGIPFAVFYGGVPLSQGDTNLTAFVNYPGTPTNDSLERRMHIFKFNSASRKWDSLPNCYHDSVTNVIAARIYGSGTYALFAPTTCCTGATGNVNMTGIVDLSDLSALVSYLTGGGYVLPCVLEANVNAAGIVDLSDLSALVSYLTGGGYQLPSCP